MKPDSRCGSEHGERVASTPLLDWTPAHQSHSEIIDILTALRKAPPADMACFHIGNVTAGALAAHISALLSEIEALEHDIGRAITNHAADLS